MEINKIKNGYVIDRIKTGRSFDIYYHLNLKISSLNMLFISINLYFSYNLHFNFI